MALQRTRRCPFQEGGQTEPPPPPPPPPPPAPDPPPDLIQVVFFTGLTGVDSDTYVNNSTIGIVNVPPNIYSAVYKIIDKTSNNTLVETYSVLGPTNTTFKTALNVSNATIFNLNNLQLICELYFDFEPLAEYYYTRIFRDIKLERSAAELEQQRAEAERAAAQDTVDFGSGTADTDATQDQNEIYFQKEDGTRYNPEDVYENNSIIKIVNCPKIISFVSWSVKGRVKETDDTSKILKADIFKPVLNGQCGNRFDLSEYKDNRYITIYASFSDEKQKRIENLEMKTIRLARPSFITIPRFRYETERF